MIVSSVAEPWACLWMTPLKALTAPMIGMM
jgi:hypothetical protein